MPREPERRKLRKLQRRLESRRRAESPAPQIEPQFTQTQKALKPGEESLLYTAAPAHDIASTFVPRANPDGSKLHCNSRAARIKLKITPRPPEEYVHTRSIYPLLLLAVSLRAAPELLYSNYLRDGFTPHSIAADASGNIYIAGKANTSAAASQTAALVAKLNPKTGQYLYLRYLGGSVSETANAIAVDTAGNAYIAGHTASPDFPISGASLGTPPSGTAKRSFVVKLNPSGNVVYSTLIGGSAESTALAIFATADGQAIVTGVSHSTGFPATTGAYSVPDSSARPFLLKLNPAGALVFSATGIGGNAIALDSPGNIYVAGTTALLDYPTTPGTYQSEMPKFLTCYGRCFIAFQGPNQYVTKVDSAGSRLIYSTALSIPLGGFERHWGQVNTGLAVDSAGNAYVTGYAGEGYPYTVTPPPIGRTPLDTNTLGLPFLSKLDSEGKTLLFSVPVGGNGVKLSSDGSVYVGGRIGGYPSGAEFHKVTAKLPALSGLPDECLPNDILIRSSAYAAQVDAISGDVRGTQFISASNLSLSGVALAGSTLWVTGPTSGPDIPYTPDVLGTIFQPAHFGWNLGTGAYAGAVDFTQTQAPEGSPKVACVLDSADFSPAGPASPLQLLSLFGSDLGPAEGLAATDYSTTNLAGVSVMFGSTPATLLYVSATQINLAIPVVPFSEKPPVMQVTVNGRSGPRREIPLTGAHPRLFLNAPETYSSAQNLNRRFVPLALNSDGTTNTGGNPARQGSVVSVFFNGLVPNPNVVSSPVELNAVSQWERLTISQVAPFVMRVDAEVPSFSIERLPANSGCDPTLCWINLRMLDNSGNEVGPFGGAYIFVYREPPVTIP